MVQECADEKADLYREERRIDLLDLNVHMCDWGLEREVGVDVGNDDGKGQLTCHTNGRFFTLSSEKRINTRRSKPRRVVGFRARATDWRCVTTYLESKAADVPIAVRPPMVAARCTDDMFDRIDLLLK